MKTGAQPGDANVDDAPRPWERPGAVRRDCVPHRAPLLDRLATAAVALFFVPPVAVLLGAWVVVETGRDLRRMEAGLMDPAGERHTRQARMAALAATVLGACLTAAGFLFALPELFDIR